MFDFLSRKKLPAKPKKEITENIKLELDQMVDQINTAIKLMKEDTPNIMEMESTDAKKRLRQIRLELRAGQNSLQNALDLWPEGQIILLEFGKFFENTYSMLDNLLEWRAYTNNPAFDIFKPSDRRKHRSYVLNNRKFASKTDYHFERGKELLREYTGIYLAALD